MNKSLLFSLFLVASVTTLVTIATVAKPAMAQVQGSLPSYVKLQATLGAQQTGNSYISGLSIASAFQGGAVTIVSSTAFKAINSTNAAPNTVSAVYGEATNPGFQNYGGFFTSAGANGTGCVGIATSLTGNPNGGFFRSDAPGGNGVTAIATATTGDAWGGNFYTNSNAGVGVYGEASALTGTTYGGKFVNNSDSGSGVYGLSNGSSGIGGYFSGGSKGIFGSGPVAVTGSSNPANGIGGQFTAYGVGGAGVFAEGFRLSGLTYAVRAVTYSPDGWAGYFTGGKGVYTERLEVNARTTTDSFTMLTGGAANTVLLGDAGGVASWGTVGSARLTSDAASLSKVTNGHFSMSTGDMQGGDQDMIQLFTGTTEKIRLNPGTASFGGSVNTFGPNGQYNTRATFVGNNNANNGLVGVYDSAGAVQASLYVDANGLGVSTADTKNFKVPDPTDPRYDILYACVEGPEAAMYTRGTGRLVNGQGVIDLPDHFLKLANMGTLTIQVTPLDECEGLFCRKGDRQFMVKELHKGASNIQFDWEVKAVRKGHEDYKVVRPWDDALPEGDVQQQWNARLKSIANRAAKSQNTVGRP